MVKKIAPGSRRHHAVPNTPNILPSYTLIRIRAEPVKVAVQLFGNSHFQLPCQKCIKQKKRASCSSHVNLMSEYIICDCTSQLSMALCGR